MQIVADSYKEGISMKKNITTVIFTLVLVVIAAFFISGTAVSQEKGKSRVDAAHYRQIEQAYVKEVRNFLGEQGYKNSGVTMTYKLTKDENRTYTVTIHHKKISALDETEKKRLKYACGEIDFPVEDCLIYHEFLETDL